MNSVTHKVFVIKNQQGLYLSKQQEWVSGADNPLLFRTQHRDEAINTVFEVGLRDIHLRAEAVACEVDAKNHPVVTAADQAQLALAEADTQPPSADSGPLPADADAEPPATDPTAD